jgi:DNA helicase-2/ATP-dependent DNA helicase PcrA
LSRVSYAKNHGITAQQMYEEAATDPLEKVASLFDLYEKKLRLANALDFDDLLLKAVELFYTASVCEQYNQRFQYVLVDEYQDTNRTQYQLIRQLTLMHQNLCVVGDEDQSIYRWRGADIQNILSFEKDYRNAKTIRLEQNYRSTQMILDAAGAVVSRNQARKGKTLWTDRKGGDAVDLFEAWDADQEALYVGDQVSKALASDANQSVAVLYRTNAQSLDRRISAAQPDCLSVGGRLQLLCACRNSRSPGLCAPCRQSQRFDGVSTDCQHSGARPRPVLVGRH